MKDKGEKHNAREKLLAGNAWTQTFRQESDYLPNSAFSILCSAVAKVSSSTA